MAGSDNEGGEGGSPRGRSGKERATDVFARTQKFVILSTAQGCDVSEQEIEVWTPKFMSEMNPEVMAGMEEANRLRAVFGGGAPMMTPEGMWSDHLEAADSGLAPGVWQVMARDNFWRGVVEDGPLTPWDTFRPNVMGMVAEDLREAMAAHNHDANMKRFIKIRKKDAAQEVAVAVVTQGLADVTAGRVEGGRIFDQMKVAYGERKRERDDAIMERAVRIRSGEEVWASDSEGEAEPWDTAVLP